MAFTCMYLLEGGKHDGLHVQKYLVRGENTIDLEIFIRNRASFHGRILPKSYGENMSV